MMQFVVPQFIEVEDKIIGPITVRQFVILLIDGLILAVCYKLVDLSLFVVLLLLLGGAGVVLAFVKINGQPFHYFFLNFLQTMRRPPLRVWQKKYTDGELKRFIKTEAAPPPLPKPSKTPLSASRLNEMILMIDTGGKYTPEE